MSVLGSSAYLTRLGIASHYFFKENKINTLKDKDIVKCILSHVYCQNMIIYKY